MMNFKTNSLKKLLSGWCVIASLSIPNFCMSQTYSAGPGSPVSVTEENASCLVCSGSQWADFNYITSADNLNSETTMAQNPICFQNNCFYARAIKASGFGFSIPGSAIITGVKAEVLRKATFPSCVNDSVVQLMLNSIPVGDSRSSGDFWPTTPAFESYGNASDAWGKTWTPAEINSSSFGLFYKPKNANSGVSSVTASIDYARVTVYYQTTTGVTESQTADNTFSTYYSTTEQNIVIRTLNLRPQHVLVNVFNEMGQQVFASDYKTNSSENSVEIISTENFSAGIYFVELRADEKSFSRKVLISK